jgi:hypothetical protein
MCVVALLLGMLLYHMLKGVCGCKSVEGLSCEEGRGPTIGGGCVCNNGLSGTLCNVNPNNPPPCVPKVVNWTSSGCVDNAEAATPEQWTICSEYTLPNCYGDCKPKPQIPECPNLN